MTPGRSWIAGGCALAAATVVGYLAGSLGGHEAGGAPEAKTPVPHARYRDPMHPAYTSDVPGKAPDCGMDLVPDPPQTAGSEAGPMGVRTERVERSSLARELKALGRVAIDEDHVVPLVPGGEGRIEAIFPGAATGSRVRKGQPLVSASGRDYTNAQRAYLYALRAAENPPPSLPGQDAGQPEVTLREARRALESLGLGSAAIDELTATRQVRVDVVLTAPADGVIVARHAERGQKVEAGTELFRIADLRHVWIVAALAPRDAAVVRPGAAARLEIPGAGVSFPATVGESLPGSGATPGSIEIRLRAEDPRGALLPGMLLDVMIPYVVADTITVPSSAIGESEGAPDVIVDAGGGRFAHRRVTVGRRTEGRVEILEGLSAGDAVVVSGRFLLDAQARRRD